jgi:hypothetical protein
MHGQSLWKILAMKTRQTSISHWTGLRTLPTIVLAIVLSSVATAQMVRTTLPELVSRSDVIFLGHVHESGGGSDSSSSAEIVSFDVLESFKGMQKGLRTIDLCNFHPDSEWPDLLRLKGDQIIFASRSGSCLKLSVGYRSAAPVGDGVAHTSGITGEPLQQSLSALEARLRRLVAHPAKAQ